MARGFTIPTAMLWSLRSQMVRPTIPCRHLKNENDRVALLKRINRSVIHSAGAFCEGALYLATQPGVS
jgi:hypothetical protein